MTPTPHLADEVLAGLARGAAPPAKAAEHLRRCPGCRGLRALLAAWPQDPPGECPDAEQLVRHADRPDPAGGALERHLTLCLPCARMVEALGQLAPARISRRPAPARPSLLERLRALVEFSPPEFVEVKVRGARATVPDATFRDAMACYKRRRFREAAERLRAVRAADRAGPEADFYLGACYLEAGLGARAVDALRDAVRGRPGLGEYRWYLAQALLLGGQGRQAERELAQAERRPGAWQEPARALRARLRRVLAEK